MRPARSPNREEQTQAKRRKPNSPTRSLTNREVVNLDVSDGDDDDDDEEEEEERFRPGNPRRQKTKKGKKKNQCKKKK
jgi:hypothetical protein